MQYDFITIGGATEDITMNTNEGVLLNNKKDITRQKLLAFEFGAKIKIEKTLSTYGGGAANTAVNFSRLGFKTLSLISVGDDDRGQKVINNLLKQGVDISAIQKYKGKETGFSFNLVGPGNEHIIFSNRGTNDLLQISGKEISKLIDTKWIYITSLSGEWEKSLKKIFSVRKVKFAWNPGGRQIKLGFKVLKNYFAKTDILCVNKDEAIELAISDPRYKNKTAVFLKNFEKLGAKNSGGY
jgi:sugar/nucleoside kinase (ribokinase family)